MKRHEWISALLMAGGTGCFYLANLIFAKMLSPESYGYFGLLLSLPALAFSFGLLGTEQVLLRHGRLDGNTIRCPAALGRAEWLAGSITTILLAIFFASKYRLPEWSLGTSLLAYGSLAALTTWLLHEVSYLRLARRFDLAQWGAQGWRIILPMLGLFLMWRGRASEGLVQAALIIAIALSVLLSFLLRRSVGLKPRPDAEGMEARGIWIEAFLFSSSLLSLSLLAQMDRLILARTLDVRSAGVYIFLLVIATGPFSLIQSYMGFTLLPKLRHRLEDESRRQILRHAYYETGGLSVLATGASIALYFFLVRRFYDPAYQRDGIFLLLLSLGWIRAFYGILSARLSASAKVKILGRSAAYGWFLSIFALLTAWWIGGKGLSSMAVVVVGFWGLRGLAWWRLALRAEAAE